MNKTVRVEISSKTIIFTVLFLLSLALLWQVKSILALFSVCFIFSEAVNASVSKLENKLKISRSLAIVLIYLLIFTAIFILIYSIVPVLVSQTRGLIDSLPNTLEEVTIFGTSAIDLSSQFKILEDLPNKIGKTALSFVSNIFSAVIVFFITFYLLLERRNLPNYGNLLFGKKGRQITLDIINQLENRLGHWVNAQLFLMLIVGILSYLGYSLLGLPYAVPLAIIAGFLELIPNLGPTATAILAGLVGLTLSPLTALLAIIWGTIVQQLENNFIVPRIMKQTIGLSPVITIFLLITGAKLGGIMSAILAIPIFLTIEVIAKTLIKAKK